MEGENTEALKTKPPPTERWRSRDSIDFLPPQAGVTQGPGTQGAV